MTINAVSVHDLEFQRIPLKKRSPAGCEFTVWERVGVPKLLQGILDCVFFLYRSRDEAKEGRNPMGTGFFASKRPAAVPAATIAPHIYAVTNWHVTQTSGAEVIRINTIQGGIDVLEPIDWQWVPGGHPHQGDDFAVADVELDLNIHRVRLVPLILFATQEVVAQRQINVGEDVFMPGLFVDHDGLSTNFPKARFGNISMMPNDTAPIKQPNSTRNSSYVLDMHSRTGFSGSPVFYYRTLGSDLDEANTGSIRLDKGTIFGLLGVHWGQFPEEFKSTDEYGRKLSLEGMSGMTCAVPAWRLRSFILDNPELKRIREERENKQRQNPEITTAARAE